MANGSWPNLDEMYDAAYKYVADQPVKDLTMTERTPRMTAQLANAFAAGARWHYGQEPFPDGETRTGDPEPGTDEFGL